MSDCLNPSRMRIVRWMQYAANVAKELAHTMGHGDPVQSRITRWGRRLRVEPLETRQLLTAVLLHTLNNPTPQEGDIFGEVAISGNPLWLMSPWE